MTNHKSKKGTRDYLGRGNRACPSDAAERLRDLLNHAGACAGFQTNPDKPGECIACGSGRSLHPKPGSQNKMWWDDD